MKKKVMLIAAIILLAAANVYSEPGDVFVEGNLGIGTTTPGAKLDVQGIVKMFGAWEIMAADTIYLAATDGFVIATGYVEACNSIIQLVGYTDNNTDPSTERMRLSARQADSNNGCMVWEKQGSFLMPVRKGDYWKVFTKISTGTNTSYIYWLPLGQ